MIATKTADYGKLFKKQHYKKWVALSPNKKQVVAYGDHPKEVLKKSKKKGIEEPVVTIALKDYSGFVT